jgi:hypothetical protein
MGWVGPPAGAHPAIALLARFSGACGGRRDCSKWPLEECGAAPVLQSGAQREAVSAQRQCGEGSVGHVSPSHSGVVARM